MGIYVASGVATISLPPTTMPSGSRTTQFPGTMAPNGAYYFRNIGGSGLISKVGIVPAVVSGNIGIGIYSSLPGINKPLLRIATTGNIACPSGPSVIPLLAPVWIDTNCYFALGADNTTATFYATGAGGSQDSTAGGGMCYWHNGGYPLGLQPFDYPVPVMGITIFMYGLP